MGTAALKVRGPEAEILTLMFAQEEEWWLCASNKEIPEMPELLFKILEVYAGDKPWSGSEHTSGGGKIKARSHSS
jgi:hypothetical protein